MGDILDFNKAPRQDEILKPNLDITDIRERLNADVKGFLAWLYSGRAFIGRGEARIGNVKGEPGASLGIALTGPEAGLWIDHATNERGDLITLYRLYRDYPQSMLGLCLKEIAKEYLGQDIEIERPSWVRSPEQQIADHRAEYGVKPRADMLELGAPAKTYKYNDTHGNIIASVVRYEPDGTRASKTFRPWCFKIVDGKRDWRPGAPDPRPLYRLPDIALASAVVLCEGEGCADALATLGIHATSAMQGCKAPIEKTDWTPLAGKTVIVWPDADEVGMDYGKRVAAHLVAIGCQVSIVEIPLGKADGWDAFDCIEEEIDPHDLIGAALPVEAPTAIPPEEFHLYTIQELETFPVPEWLLEGVLTQGGLSMLWAGSDSYKTFVALDMGLCISEGMEWFGRKTKPGLVIYIAAEDPGGVQMRVTGWRKTRGNGSDLRNFRIFRDGIVLASPDRDKLITAIMGLMTLGIPIALIIIDTLAQTFGFGNENQTQDMNAYVHAAKLLQAATAAHVMIIHHTGKNTEQERGNRALRAAMHNIIAVDRVNDKRIKLINRPPKGKQKNADPFPDMPLRLQKVHFEFKGKECSTLVIMPDDAEPTIEEPQNKAGMPRLGQIEKRIVAALEAALEKGRDHLGFTSLLASIGGDKGTLGRSLRKLVDKGLILETEEDNKRSFSLCSGGLSHQN